MKSILFLGCFFICYCVSNILSANKAIQGFDMVYTGFYGDTVESANIMKNRTGVSYINNPSVLAEQGKIIAGRFIYDNKVYASYYRNNIGINYAGVFGAVFIPGINTMGIGINTLFIDSYTSAKYTSSSDIFETQKIGGKVLGYILEIGKGVNCLKNIDVGMNLKFVNEKIVYNNIGGAADIGLRYVNNNFGFGAVFKDIGIFFTKNEQEIFPMRIDFGGYYGFYLSSAENLLKHRFNIYETIGYYIFDKKIQSLTGIGYIYYNMINIQINYKNDTENNFLFSGGVSVMLYHNKFLIHYGISYNFLGLSHRIGIEYKWTSRRSIIHKKKQGEISIQEKKGEKYVNLSSKKIFRDNSSKIKESGKSILQTIIERINIKRTEKMVKIYVCMNSKQDKKNSTDLSKRRAVALHDFFINEGIDKDRLVYTDYSSKEAMVNDMRNEYDDAAEFKESVNGCIEIIVSRLSKKEKELFDYYYFTGLDYKIKGLVEEAMKNLEEALKIDPENKRLKQQINELKQSIEKKKK